MSFSDLSREEQTKAVLDETDNVPHLSERMIIDLVNGLEVSSELMRYRDSQGRLSRFMGWLDGSNDRRDKMIEQNHQVALENIVQWVQDISRCENITAQTLKKTIDKLDETRKHVINLTKGVMKHEDAIEEQYKMINRLHNQMSEKFQAVNEEIRALRIENRANLRLNSIMEGWESGRLFRGYSPLLQTVLALDSLTFGEEGRVIYGDSKYFTMMVDKALNILNRLYGLRPKTFMRLNDWIHYYGRLEERDSVKPRIISYLVGNEDSSHMHIALSKYVMGDNIVRKLASEEKIHLFYNKEDLVELLVKESGSLVQQGVQYE